MAPPNIRSGLLTGRSNPSSTQLHYQYPFATAPDIIRSYQKDTFFQAVLLENLSNVLQTLYGTRFIHNYTSEARTFTELLYFGCTTLIGNRTLGEEYCDLVQVEDDTLKLPHILRRAGYIVSTVLLPYLFSKTLPAFRAWVRLKFDRNLRRLASCNDSKVESIGSQRLQSYIISNLQTLTSFSPLYALSLSIFYFKGSYYHIGKRLLGLRYIFTKRLEPSDQRIGYEVLGVLLVLQMTVHGWLHLHNTIQSNSSTLSNPGTLRGESAVIDGRVEVGLGSNATDNLLLFESESASSDASRSRLELSTHTLMLEQPMYALKDTDKLGWIQGTQQRKCTLCLEELKDPSATTCGHVFCWSCIANWIKEKPECPLCRQSIMAQHVLPLRG